MCQKSKSKQPDCMSSNVRDDPYDTKKSNQNHEYFAFELDKLYKRLCDHIKHQNLDLPKAFAILDRDKMNYLDQRSFVEGCLFREISLEKCELEKLWADMTKKGKYNMLRQNEFVTTLRPYYYNE